MLRAWSDNFREMSGRLARIVPYVLILALAWSETLAIQAPEARTRSFKLQTEGMRLYKEGQFEDAIVAFQQVVQLNLNSFLAYYYLGASLVAARRYGEAIGPLKIALDLQPDYIQAHLALGDAYLKLGDGSEARAEYLRALEQQPNFAAAHDGLGRLFESTGDDKSAEMQYRRALEINIAFADAYTHLGDLYLRRDRLDDAIDLFLKAISIKLDFSSAYTRLGVAYAKRGQYDEAIAAARKSQQLTPYDPDPYVALAYTYLKLGSFQRTESQILSALALDHDNPLAHLVLSGLMRALENFDSAQEILEDLYERGIEDSQMRKRVGKELTRVREDAAIYADLKAAAEISPPDPGALVSLARFVSKQGSHRSAADLLERAAALLDGVGADGDALDRPEMDDTAPDDAAGAVDTGPGDPTAEETAGAHENEDAADEVPVATDTGELETGGGDFVDDTGKAPGETVPSTVTSMVPFEDDAHGEDRPDIAIEEGSPILAGDLEEPVSPATLSPGDPVRFEAGVELINGRVFGRAIELYENLTTIASDDPAGSELRAAALFNLGVARAYLGLDSAAADAFTSYIEVHPDDADAHLYLGNALYRLGHGAEARTTYMRYLEMAVASPDTTRVQELLRMIPRPVRAPDAVGTPDGPGGDQATEGAS